MCETGMSRTSLNPHGVVVKLTQWSSASQASRLTRPPAAVGPVP